MNLSQEQREVSLALNTSGFIVNWFQNFGKPVLTIYLNENEEDRLNIKFTVNNIYYDYSIEPHFHVSKSKKSLLIKAFGIINSILPKNNNPENVAMRKFEPAWITPGYIEAQED